MRFNFSFLSPLFWPVFLFTGLALTQLGLVNNDLRPATFLPLVVLILCGGTAAYLLPHRSGGARRPAPKWPVAPAWRSDPGPLRAGEPILLPLTFFLSGLGLVLINRLAPAFVTPQMVWLIAATGLLLLVTLVPKNLGWLRRYKYTWLIGGLSLLATTLLFGVNPSGFGARLWLQVGQIYFQPSEPLKLLLIVFLAAYLADRRRHLIEVKAYIGRVAVPHPSYFGPMLLMWGFSIILLVWQRDLGAALLFFGTFVGMLYVATGQGRYIWAGLGLLAVAGSIGYVLFDVVRLRVEAFWNPWLDPAGRSFQIVQSLLAFASGGFLGQGLGQGLPTAIPVVHTDFVFAAIGEEYGLLGASGVLVCFVLLVSRAFHIALQAKSSFEQLLAAGIATILGLQTILIMAGTLKLLPLTGVTLPFVSYGGSSLVTSFIMVGLLLFIARRNQAGESEGVNGEAWFIQRSALGIHHLSLAWGLLTGFLIVAGGLIFWQIALAPFLVNRTDNPRLIIAEQQIRRGRLLTAAGIPVAETIIGEDGLAERHYPYAGLSSVTGYYSLRYGVGGTEAVFDPILRGTAGRTAEAAWLDNLLHCPSVGRDVTLTVDLPAQVAADIALGKQEGAVVVMEIETGAILVMSSHPTYDPNRLDEAWDSLRQDQRAPLLNRATQGLFPVGDLARLVGLIGLYDTGLTLPPEPLTAPLEGLLAPLSRPGYLATARQVGLSRPLPGFASQVARLPDFEGRGTVRDLAVTPLHLVRVMAALELEGRLPNPVLAEGAGQGQTQAFGPDTARYIRSLLPQAGEQMIGFWGEATPQETGQSSLSWFAGLAPAKAVPAAAEAAATAGELILDPSQIPPTPTPITLTERSPARYAVVAVVVTDKPENRPALRIARAPLNILLEQQSR